MVIDPRYREAQSNCDLFKKPGEESAVFFASSMVGRHEAVVVNPLVDGASDFH